MTNWASTRMNESLLDLQFSTLGFSLFVVVFVDMTVYQEK
jgi:hypothetical protein